MPNLVFIALHGTWLLLLAIWLGGTVFVTFIAAPTAFAKLPTRAAAGDLVGAMLTKFGRWTLVCIVGLAILGGARLALYENFVAPVIVRTTLLALAAGTVLAGVVWLEPKLHALRDALSPIDEIPESDPRRQRFRKLHGLSMMLTLAQLLLGIGVLYLS